MLISGAAKFHINLTVVSQQQERIVWHNVTVVNNVNIFSLKNPTTRIWSPSSVPFLHQNLFNSFLKPNNNILAPYLYLLYISFSHQNVFIWHQIISFLYQNLLSWTRIKFHKIVPNIHHGFGSENIFYLQNQLSPQSFSNFPFSEGQIWPKNIFINIWYNKHLGKLMWRL